MTHLNDSASRGSEGVGVGGLSWAFWGARSRPGAPPNSKTMRMGRAGERRPILQPPRVYLSLDYTCQGKGEGVRGRIPQPVPSAPLLNPSLRPGDGGYHPQPALCMLLPLSPSRPSCLPSLPPPAPSAIRIACKARRDLAGPPAHGLTSGLGMLLAFLSWTFCYTIAIRDSKIFLVTSLSPHFFFFFGSSRK